MTEQTSIQKHLTGLIAELKKSSKKLSESEFDELLKEEVIPGLIEDEEVFGTSIWMKIHLVKTIQMDSILDERGLSIERAIQFMNVDAICWMVELANNITELLEMIERKRKHNLEDEDMPSTMKYLEREAKQLTKWLLYDAYNRNQEYEFELKELNGRS
ncbi:hypothetical protein [Gracilimonas sp.]|uniref:hypothetical protein n=1 Tax=Gracilimonas sp. TaxID=1974203 RepID=UPI003BA9E876